MRSATAFLLAILLPLSGPAQAAATSRGHGLSLDASAPPVVVSGDRYRFAPGIEFDVLPAVVLEVDPDAWVPPAAESLGGRSWRLPVASAAEAVRQALLLDALPGTIAFPDVVLHITRAQDTSQTDPADFDDPARGGQWYLDELSMDELFAVSLGDPSTRVAVLDSGIDISHVDLVDAVDAPYDAYRDDDDPSPDPGEYCGSASSEICDTHGTSVAGVVAARANNGAGIVGMCPTCTLIPVKLLGEGSSASNMTIVTRAFEHAIAQDVAVINNSWGFTDSEPVPATLAKVIDRAATEPRDGKGALVIFAAGNDDREIQGDEMEALDSVLCVSAVDSYGYPTNYTNFGPFIDVAAPSATVSIAPGDLVIDDFGGTSGAAPVVSGLAAWAVSVDPSLTAAELKALLIETAEPSPLVTFDENGHNDYYGYGTINALAVRDALLGAGGGTGDTGDTTDTSTQPGGCGCSGAPSGISWLFGLLALPLLWTRRR
ncbi:MAG: S8 family serine peptidase [Oligoflexia bacterium]|nr:S8 family serine peptidase [Oligoflexia bacterium]